MNLSISTKGSSINDGSFLAPYIQSHAFYYRRHKILEPLYLRRLIHFCYLFLLLDKLSKYDCPIRVKLILRHNYCEVTQSG